MEMKWNKRKLLTLPAVIVLGMSTVLAGCGDSSPSTSATTPGQGSTDKLQIVTSFYPMQEFTSKVAGDLADVQVLIPPGTEPHDWEPTPQDIAKITEADMLVYNGAGLESWMTQVQDAVGTSGPKMVEASKGVQVMDGYSEEEEHEGEEHAGEEAHDHAAEEGHDHDHGGMDPHVWLSPMQAQTEVRNIETALSELAPDHAADFKKNADTYLAELKKLDEDYKKDLSSTKRKDFITQHTAFGYLARDYGLTQVGISGLSPEEEPTAAKMAEVVDFAKKNNVKTIFFETLVSSKVADTIANEVGAQTAVLNPLEGLTSEQAAAGEDYISVMRENLAALTKALNE